MGDFDAETLISKIAARHAGMKPARTTVKLAAEQGADLIALKAALPHGDFQRTIVDCLPFSYSVASGLMKIALHGQKVGRVSARGSGSVRQVLSLIEAPRPSKATAALSEQTRTKIASLTSGRMSMSLPEDFAGLTPESARRCQLIHGDCLEKLAEIPEKSIDLILTDLPSGVSGLYWDQPIDLGRLWSHYRRLIRPNGPIVLFASQPYATDLVVGNREWLKYELIWEKDHKTGFVHAKNKPLRAHENILVFSEGATFHEGHTNRRMPFFPQGVVPNTQKLVTYSNGRQKSAGFKSGYRKPNIWEHTGYPNTILKFSSDRLCLHPVEKPIALLEYLIRTYCPDDGMVLDSAMGGGSTGIAAANTGRRFIGIEKDAEFFRIAAEVLSVSGRESA